MTLALVTGAPGWLGTRLVEVLFGGLGDVPALARPAAERRVRCLVFPGSDTRRLRQLGAEIVEGDLADPAALERFTDSALGATLFHVAGLVHPRRTRELFVTNVGGTDHLIARAERAAVRRLVFVSSNSPFGTNPSPNDVFDETAPYRPYMKYGKSKMLAEQLVLAAERRGKLETVIVRPPWFYGPGQPPRQSLFFELIKDGRVPIVGAGDNRRSMVYVDNLCQGLLLAAEIERARGNAYWIADRRPYSMNEIVDTIERVLERDFGVQVKHQRWHLPGITSEMAWVADKLLQTLGLYQQKIHVLSEMNKTIACSIAKAEHELGYDPKVELEEGMRRSIRWLIDQGGEL